MPAQVDICREPLASPSARELVAALSAELRGRYGNPLDCHFDLVEDEVRPGRGTFAVAAVGGMQVGCGAVRLIGEGLAEAETPLRPARLPRTADRGRSLGLSRDRSPFDRGHPDRSGDRDPLARGARFIPAGGICRDREIRPLCGLSRQRLHGKGSRIRLSHRASRVPGVVGGSLRGPFGHRVQFVEVRHARR